MKKYLFVILCSVIILSCKKNDDTIASLATTSTFTLTSTAVVNNLLLDAFKCEAKVNGVENSIPLVWTNAPATANAFAITMIHYPNPNDLTVFNSYLELWGIDKSVTSIAYGKADDGPWFMGPNKDLKDISYSSPCSAGSGTHKYTITIYALSATPSSLPTKSSLSVTNQVLMAALSTVTIIDKATLVFDSITP
jgi:phosphatidylethanolamine-binding protein (PEBP) family uncharacterized protein